MQTAALVRTASSRLCGILGTAAQVGTIGLLLLLSSAVEVRAEQSAVDDGWRRTKSGWENIRDWQLSPEQLQQVNGVAIAPAILSPTAEHLLVLSHPLVIAAAVCVLGIGGMSFATSRQLEYDGNT